MKKQPVWVPAVCSIKRGLTRLGLDRPAKLAGDVLSYHMDPVQVGEVARDAGVGKLVLPHVFPPPPEFLDRTFTEGAGSAFGGSVIMGEDGMFLTLNPRN